MIDPSSSTMSDSASIFPDLARAQIHDGLQEQLEAIHP